MTDFGECRAALLILLFWRVDFALLVVTPGRSIQTVMSGQLIDWRPRKGLYKYKMRQYYMHYFQRRDDRRLLDSSSTSTSSFTASCLSSSLLSWRALLLPRSLRLVLLRFRLACIVDSSSSSSASASASASSSSSSSSSSSACLAVPFSCLLALRTSVLFLHRVLSHSYCT